MCQTKLILFFCQAIEAGTSADAAETLHPLYRGEVIDWAQLEKLRRLTLDEIGLTSPESASVMLTESPRSTFEERKKWAELLFETFRVPSMCIGNSAPLSLFASGRTNGIVVECGAGLTSSVPVFEGLALVHASITMEYGGQDISQNLRRILEDRNVTIDLADARILKERMSVVANTKAANIYQPADDLNSFSLPDGTEVTLERKIFSECVEPLICGRMLDKPMAVRPLSSWGLVDQTFESLRLCDDSTRRDLCNNVVLAGGTSMLPGIRTNLYTIIFIIIKIIHIIGLGDRLEAELISKFSEIDSRSQPSFDVRVIPHSSYR